MNKLADEINLTQYMKFYRLSTRKQVGTVGIHFNYMKEHRHVWKSCIVVHLLSLISSLVTFSSYRYTERRDLMRAVVNSINIGDIIQNCSIIQVSLSFITLLRALYIRFAALNKFFRLIS